MRLTCFAEGEKDEGRSDQLPVDASRRQAAGRGKLFKRRDNVGTRRNGINRQALEIPSSRNSEDTWKIKRKSSQFLKIKIMKRDFTCFLWQLGSLTHRRSVLCFYRSHFPTSAFEAKAGIKHSSASALVEHRELGTGHCYMIAVTLDALSVTELDAVCSTRAHPSTAWSNFCCVVFRQQKWDTFLSLKLLVLCKLIKKSRLFLSF